MQEHRAAYNELVNIHLYDGHPPLLGIRHTNSFGMSPVFCADGETYCGVLNIGSSFFPDSRLLSKG